MSLACVWTLPYLPMQDYPQHLFQAKLVGQSLTGQPVDPAYAVHLHPTYSVFYLLVFLFSAGGRLLDIDTAGRCAVSIYPLMVAAVVFRLLWWRGRRAAPSYAAFLLMPLAFNQSYYLGFMNYLYGLPLCFWAFLDVLRGMRQGCTRRRAGAHALVLAALLMTNSIAFVMYGLVIGPWWLLHLLWLGNTRRMTVPLATAALLALTAVIRLKLAPGSQPMNVLAMSWVPWTKDLNFWALGWTGDRLTTGPHLVVLIIWVAAALLCLWTTARHGWLDRHIAFLAGIGAATLFVATLVLPFSVANVAYLGIRMAEGSYFFLIAAATMVRFQRPSAGALFPAALLLMIISFSQQFAISAEIAQIAPLIHRMEPNATVFPMVWARSSPELDPSCFFVHLHDVYYYHLAKGGLSPYLFPTRPASGTPVTYAAATLPAPDQLYPAFRWELAPSAYRYILLRGGTPDIDQYVTQHARGIGASGYWLLYQTDDVASSTP
jgi:hypothetical protein